MKKTIITVAIFIIGAVVIPFISGAAAGKLINKINDMEE